MKKLKYKIIKLIFNVAVMQMYVLFYTLLNLIYLKKILKIARKTGSVNKGYNKLRKLPPLKNLLVSYYFKMGSSKTGHFLKTII